MFLSNKPARLTTAAKTRLNTHAHKLDNIEARKRSPDGTGPPSPSEVIVFNNTNHGNGYSRGGNNGTHINRNLPEVPQIEEIQQYLRDMWDRKMHEIKTQNLKVLWLKSDRDFKREGAAIISAGSHQLYSNNKKHSPQHSNRK